MTEDCEGYQLVTRANTFALGFSDLDICDQQRRTRSFDLYQRSQCALEWEGTLPERSPVAKQLFIPTANSLVPTDQ